MSVAPELPPLPVARRGESGPSVRRARPGPSTRRSRSSLRAVPVLVDRTPAGVVAVVEPIRRSTALVERPVTAFTVTPPPMVRPTLDWPVEELDGATGPVEESGVGLVHRPASPVRLRPAGARVVREARPGLRLTRRGRLVAAAVTLVIAALTLVGVASRVGSLTGSAPVPASAPSQVVVAPGETLWSIAERVAPRRDPRPVVAQIRRLNGLPSGDVQAGQTLLLRAP